MSANEYGAIFAQSGVPVSRSADYQRVLDSRWKFMEIAQFLYIDMIIPTRSGSSVYLNKILEHNLGFLPAFYCSPLNISIGFDIKISATKNAIWGYIPAVATSAITVRGWLYVFNVDVTTYYKAPYNQPSFAPTGDTSYGAKFLEEDSHARIDDSGTVGFSLNTQAKALGVHMHDTYPFDGAGVGPIISHGLGYPPTFLNAKMDTPSSFNNNEASIGPLGQPARALITNQTIQFRGAQSILLGNYAYIILKDPSDIVQ